MPIESKLRTLRATSLAVAAFAVILLFAGLVQIGFGGIAVKEHYDRLAAVEAMAREASPYDQNRAQADAYAAYKQSSTAFINESRAGAPAELPEPGSPVFVSALVLLAAAIGFLLAAMTWVWRAHANLREVGIPSKYGPGKALAAYLIPMLNLVLPFEAMRELYNRSHGEPDELVDASVDDVTAWWTAVVVGLLIFSAMTIKFAMDLGSNLIIMTPLWMEYAIAAFAIVLLLCSAFLFSRLVRTITRAQLEYLPSVDPTHFEETGRPRPAVTIVRS